MIKELAKTIVKDRRMNSAIKSAESHADYLVTLHQTNLLKHSINIQRKTYADYPPTNVTQLTNELRIIKDETSRNLLVQECSKLILINSLQEIL